MIKEKVDENSDLGFMFYYGGTSLSNKLISYSEPKYKLHFLQHVLIGISVL